MSLKQPIKDVLSNSIRFWDRDGVRAAVRENFRKVLLCRTPALGAEVYGSDAEQKLLFHTCKSRACPSCGHRATRLWQREQWATLPEIPYRGIVFTMPDALWPVFQQNRHLLRDLPALGAEIVKNWAWQQAGARVLLTVVPHTFGRHLNFNCHLHILVSAGGLRYDGRWVRAIQYDAKLLAARWRFAVVTFLRMALKQGVLRSSLSVAELKKLFTTQYERKWVGHVSRFSSKEHFLRYGGRYVRRPPIAQYRIVSIDAGTVRFRTEDHKLKCEVIDEMSLQAFVQSLAVHVPDRYCHGVRHFGLCSPRSRRNLWPTVYRLLGQPIRPKPIRLSWARSIEKEFRVDPLRDDRGRRMQWIGRIAPQAMTTP